MNVEVISGSAVLAAVISGFVSYFVARRTDRLRYITDERKTWRNEIREISKRLQGASYETTLCILTDLKVRINAYGANECSKRYKDDVHIWKVIKEIESDELTNENLKYKQNQLIEYLALLLKDDWEKSKREVQGDKYFLLSIMFFCASGIGFCGVVYYYTSSKIPLPAIDKIFYVVTYLLCLVLPTVIMPVEHKYFCEQLIGGVIKDKAIQNKLWGVALSYIICGISLLVVLGFNCGTISTFYRAVSAKKDIALLGVVFLQMFGCGFQYVAQTGNLEQKYFYYKSINAIREKYEGQKYRSKESFNEKCVTMNKIIKGGDVGNQGSK